MSPTTLDGPTLSASTAPAPLSDGSLRVHLDDQWNGLNGGPLGGYTMAAVLRALTISMPGGTPLSATATFLRPATVGDLDVTPEIVRTGRTLSVGAARAVQNGREIMRLTATFGLAAERSGPTMPRGSAPGLPRPHECVDPLGGASIPGVTVSDRVEYRFVEPPGWTVGAPTGAAEQQFWMRLRRPEPVDASVLALLVDAAAPGVLELGAGGSSTVELSIQFRGVPATDWLACRCSTRFLIDGLHEEDFEIWDANGRLVCLSRQFAVAR